MVVGGSQRGAGAGGCKRAGIAEILKPVLKSPSGS